MLTRVGWEPPQTWPVARAGEPPLVFQTRLPAAEFVPAAELPAQRRDALASLGGDAMSAGAGRARRGRVPGRGDLLHRRATTACWPR